MSRPIRAVRDESGVIAIVVALAMSTFLLGFAALAVDMGTAYTRKSELKSVADRLALAGAKGLPNIGTAQGALDEIDKTLRLICQDETLPGVCRDDGTAPPIEWAVDGSPGNGEVSFFADADGNGQYVAGEQVAPSAGNATALRVDLAPSQVDFGLAGTFGRDSATIHGTATARVGTPIGSGILPFALTPDDLSRGQFCVRDPATPGLPSPPDPTGSVFLRIMGTVPVSVVYQHEDETPLVIRLTVPDPGPAGLRNEAFHLSTTTAEVPFTRGAAGFTDTATQTFYTVTLPTGEAMPKGVIWATGTQLAAFGTNSPFITSTVNDPGPRPGLETDAEINYSGLPAGVDTLCAERAADRGFIKLNRPEFGSDAQELTRNIRSSPSVKLYPVGGLLGTVGDTVTCAATRVVAATTCLSSMTSVSFGTAMTAGFLSFAGDTPGRLIGDCGNDTMTSHGRPGVDKSKLFQDPGFIEPSGHAGAGTLKDRIINGTSHSATIPRDEGWITSKVLRCPRLAVMPVIDPRSLVGTIGGQSIQSFRYVWIDNEEDDLHRGLNGDASNITSFRGYIIDPGFLSPVVAGSGQVGPYLGDDMPKEALLIAGFSG